MLHSKKTIIVFLGVKTNIYCCHLKLIGLSFKRPYLMEGLNLMIATFEPKTVDFVAKTMVFAENCGFQVETTVFAKNWSFSKTTLWFFGNHTENHGIHQQPRFSSKTAVFNQKLWFGKNHISV